MFELFLFSLLQLSSFSSSFSATPADQSTATTQTATLDGHGTSGWGEGHITADHGTSGWGEGH
ncbi:hypothetical protein DNI29_04780 [Hymenobacter sediminis]|uniref:hypothetical protein n=1 Tax=Hymenobacter sediminis TaxID=2218621 RepID=UPI000DA689CE|nr:hypothetical protein [Hymenobacter sediminis]RPD50117.1 hypothetical protein DNI29_04780 [Hymenobacter sediminis]